MIAGPRLNQLHPNTSIKRTILPNCLDRWCKCNTKGKHSIAYRPPGIIALQRLKRGKSSGNNHSRSPLNSKSGTNMPPPTRCSQHRIAYALRSNSVTLSENVHALQRRAFRWNIVEIIACNGRFGTLDHNSITHCRSVQQLGYQDFGS